LFVAFVDLLKAYNTANHDLLLKVLEKYGTPPKFVAAIKKCVLTSRLFSKLTRKSKKFPRVLAFNKATKWPLFFSSSSCLRQLKH
jgi:hypothetical protein